LFYWWKRCGIVAKGRRTPCHRAWRAATGIDHEHIESTMRAFRK
jgi:hypothetical protein